MVPFVPLQPGDRLMAIAPSGTLRETEAFHRSLDLWRAEGYGVDLAEGYDRRWGYLAGTDDQRGEQLLQAWQDPRYRGVLAIRGGWGAARLLEAYPWPQGGGSIAGNVSGNVSGTMPGSMPGAIPGTIPGEVSGVAAPKWLLGFSDVTALLWSLYGAGGLGLHGPVLTTLAAEPDWSQRRLFGWLRGEPLEPLQGEGWGGGVATGALLPGNLTVATHLLGTRIQPDLRGVILAFEDVGEMPYRIDRLLTQWRMTGALHQVAGVALGRFSQSEPSPGVPSFSVEEVLHDRLGDLGIPVVSGLPFGHDGPNALLPVGVPVVLDGDRGVLAFG